MGMDNKRRAQIGLRYGPNDMGQYHKVMDLAKKEGLSNSETGKRLIGRGFKHMDNPGPLVKVVEKIREVPVEKIVKVPVYRDPPKVDKSTQEPVAMDDHITDEYIGEGVQSQQHLSGDKLMTGDKAEPSPDTALDIKKSPNDEGSSIGGWIALSGFLAIIFGPMVYRWLTPKQIEPVNQIGKPNEFTEKVDQSPYI